MKKLKRTLCLLLAMLIMMAAMPACSSEGDNTPSQPVSSDTGGTETDAGNPAPAYQPTQPLTVVCCASAGGDSDLYVRYFADKMTNEAGVAVVVENIGGGSGSIGMQNVLDAGTGGTTALFYQTGLNVAASAGSIPNYTSELFDVVGCVIEDTTSAWFVSAESDYYNIQDIIDAALAAPGEIVYGAEVGAYTYASLLLFEEETGCDLHVADVGNSAEKQAALLAGTIDILPTQWVAGKEYVESGLYRCIGIASPERSEACPDVPTFAEYGVTSSIPRYFMMAFPKGTDKAIEDYWAGVLSDICSDPANQDELFALGGATMLADPVAGVQKWLDQETYFQGISDKMR